MKKSTTLQFDLEQQIMHCWNVCEDIQLVYTWVCDDAECNGIPPQIADKIANALLGMETIYNMKFNRLFNTFEAYLRERHIEKIAGNSSENQSTEEEYFNDPFNSLYTD